MQKNLCVLFDCDGTLVDSLNHGWGSWEHAYARIGLEFPHPDDIKKFFGMSADKIFFNLLNDRKKASSAFEHYCDYELKHVSRVRVFDGMMPLLIALKEHEIRTGIITGRHYRDLAHIIDHHDIRKYFNVIVTDDTLENSKPHPEGILKAMKALEAEPCRTFYIGDSVMDMQAASSAGVHPVAAVWDKLARGNELVRERPVLSASHPLEILSFLKGLK